MCDMLEYKHCDFGKKRNEKKNTRKLEILDTRENRSYRWDERDVQIVIEDKRAYRCVRPEPCIIIY